MKSAHAGLLAAFGLLIAPMAFADTGTGSKQAKFDKIDSNSDGEVTRDEFATSARQHFATCDSNHDGFLTLTEMKASEVKKGAKGMSPTEKIKKFDTDGDGRLTIEEMTTGKQAMFDTMDKDQDGRLTESEFSAGLR
jgi:Ca2+-binding EF-hand superfamily protein